jgi:pimeloyl-ACP methyl ester carboxylesterase
MGMVEGVGDPAPIVAALEASSLKEVGTVRGRMFRAFAEATGSNLASLAACMRSSRQTISAEEIASITVPVLVTVGTRDVISGSGAGLAALIPGAVSVDIIDRDHMNAVGDRQYKQAVLDFLEQRP